MSENKVFNCKVTVRMTDVMYQQLVAEMRDTPDIAKHIRDILRDHLDESEEIRGNRRAQRQVVQKETLRIRWYLVILTALAAHIGSALIMFLVKLPENERANFTPDALLRHAEL